MTRLTNKDICDISPSLSRYGNDLISVTKKTLLGIASYTLGESEAEVRSRLAKMRIYVIPITAGEGIITDFSQTVADILAFLGCEALVTEHHDAAGLAQAYEDGAEAVMLADDNRFVGINLYNRRVADNCILTGRIYAGALDLMAGGLKDSHVLVMGCGPVGAAGASALLDFGARVVLYDIRIETAKDLKKKLEQSNDESDIRVADTLENGLLTCSSVLEATNFAATIADRFITDNLMIAAPGVPLGLSENGIRRLGKNLIHDKLELGVAGMAAFLSK